MITIEEESCRIIHYTKIYQVSLTEVIVQTKKQRLTISGEHLKIRYLDHDEMIIRGDLKKVVFDDVSR